jgi:hypothetical protein
MVVEFLPARDRTYLQSHGFSFDEIDGGGQKGVILRSVVLPAGRYDAESTDVLIIVPGGYPDAQPDMFYTLPWVRLKSSGAYPSRADQPIDFAGQRWQRWSRHSDQWRPGRDGIWTMIKRFEHAVEIAT